ncbi:MAG: hypothetical protein SGJ10_12820 [Bacteroidota bacterium]|nr:hypothetical protein [Bacteroidota bacterium]
MKYKLDIEIDDSKKILKAIGANEITNSDILKSIEAYEKGKVIPILKLY